MSTSVAVESPAKWTWADLLSTYRFWALLLFYLLSSASIILYSTSLPILIREQALSAADVGFLFGVRRVSGLLGLYLAWVATRWRPTRMLVLMGVVQLVGAAFLVVPALAVSSPIRIVGAALVGVGYSAVLLAVPALLAESRSGAKSFVLAFGVVLTVSGVTGVAIPYLAGFLVWVSPAFPIIALLVLGILVLLPVKPGLFQDQPSARGQAFPPKHRSPAAVAFLCIVPFYVQYWLYRLFGEAASVTGSRALLSPRGALGVSFVPLLVPIMLTTLVEELNAHAERSGARRLHSARSIFLWCVFGAPVGVALVQAAMNKAASARQ